VHAGLLAGSFLAPPEWRSTLSLAAVLGFLAWQAGRRYGHLEGVKRFSIQVGLAYVPLLIFIFFAYEPLSRTWLAKVESAHWGGMLLNLLITVFGIMFSFPLGILFALGRRSSLPVIRLFSILYIEFIRGVPFITILFMAQVMFPILLPPEMSIDRVVRAFGPEGIGAHLHSRPDPAEVRAKVDAVLAAGVRWLEGALGGVGGCPLAGDELVGNLPTEVVVPYLVDRGFDPGPDLLRLPELAERALLIKARYA